MRESKAKQTIVKTAMKLIEKKGYSNLNVNEVAYVAEVSVGTLYYHFPKGKTDILTEIMAQKMKSYMKKFNEQEGMDSLKNMSLEDALRWIFKKVIELRRPDRHFLLALQSEMLTNPDELPEFLEKYQSSTGLRQGMGVISEIILQSKDIDLKKLAERQEPILKLVGLLMSYQIMFPGYFGDDNEFVDLILRIFFEVLRS